MDDAAHVIRVLRLVRKRSGDSVVSAADCNEALIRMARQLPDVLVIDIQIEGMDGMDESKLCRTMRARYLARPS